MVRVNSAFFCFFLLLTLVGCVGQSSSNSLNTTSINVIPFEVTSTVPADGTVTSAAESDIYLTFSTIPDLTSVTFNTSTGMCYGSVQLSKDNFASCVPFLASATLSDKTVILIPQSVMQSGVTYQIRTSSALKSKLGTTISSLYAHSLGFQVAGDLESPTLSSSSPRSSETEVELTRSIQLTFSEPMDSSTILANTAGTTCSGSVQVSKDSFTTCIQMQTTPIPSNGARTFTFDPVSKLEANSTYQVKIKNTVKDIVGKTISGGEKIFSFATAKLRTVRISWDQSLNTAVNTSGGGHRVYYSMTENFNTDTAASVNVPYVSGATAPAQKDITLDTKGRWYFKVVAYSLANPAGSGVSTETYVDVE